MSLLSSLKKTANGLVATFKDGSQVPIAVPSGRIGEKLSFTSVATSIPAGNTYTTLIRNTAVNKGVYLVTFTCTLFATTSQTTGQAIFYLKNNSVNEVVLDFDRYNWGGGMTTSNGVINLSFTKCIVVSSDGITVEIGGLSSGNGVYDFRDYDADIIRYA